MFPLLNPTNHNRASNISDLSTITSTCSLTLGGTYHSLLWSGPTSEPDTYMYINIVLLILINKLYHARTIIKFTLSGST